MGHWGTLGISISEPRFKHVFLCALSKSQKQRRSSRWVTEVVISKSLLRTHQKLHVWTRSAQNKARSEADGRRYIILSRWCSEKAGTIFFTVTGYNETWSVATSHQPWETSSSFAYDFQTHKQEMIQVKLVLQNKRKWALFVWLNWFRRLREFSRLVSFCFLF